MSSTGPTDVTAFAREVRTWLEAEAAPAVRPGDDPDGDINVAVFHQLNFDEEQLLIAEISAWAQRRAERGYHAISWEPEYGGLGLSRAYAVAFARESLDFAIPPVHELASVSMNLIPNTIKVWGTDEQRQRFIPQLLAARMLACQLFSEPGAGSDLASLGCRAVRDGDEWVLNGQKVWSSGAQYCKWGLLIARTDPDEVKHKGMTAFMVPLDEDGVEVRPIRQMNGGSSFGEVFFTDLRVSDDLRIGAEGEGWRVALTTLGFERDHSASGSAGVTKGGTWPLLLETARAQGVTEDLLARQDLSRMYIHSEVEHLLNRRASDLARSGTPGPEGSLGKLMWTEGMRLMTETIGRVLGPKLVVETGERATYAWSELMPGVNMCSAPLGTALRADPMRSSATLLASEFWGCQANHGSTRTSPGRIRCGDDRTVLMAHQRNHERWSKSCPCLPRR